MAAINGGDNDAAQLVQRMFGGGRNPETSDAELADIKKIAKMYQNNDKSEGPSKQEYQDEATKKFADAEMAKALAQNTLGSSTKEVLIDAAAKAGIEAVNATGSILQTNGHRLAEAILKGLVSNDESYNRVYGKSGLDKGLTYLSYQKMRKGDNAKHVTDALVNTGNEVRDKINREQDLIKQSAWLATQPDDRMAASYDLAGRYISGSNKDRDRNSTSKLKSGDKKE